VADTQKFIQSSLQQFADNKGFVAVIRAEGSIAGVIGYNEIDWQNQPHHSKFFLF
jgi:ribosomal-protein-serine acetyltransferase